jgi:hypothetical protein
MAGYTLKDKIRNTLIRIEVNILKSILKGSYEGVKHSGLLGFGLRPSSRILNTGEHNVSETESVCETLCSLVFFRMPGGGRSPKTQ